MAPDVYTHGHEDAVLRSHRWRTVANSAAYLRHHLQPGARLLDVGCGPGTLTADMAQLLGGAGERGRGLAVGIDVVAGVLTEARANARAKNVDNVVFAAADIYRLGLRDGTRFDVVHAHQVLQHLSDPVGGLQAMARAARPGGIVAARDGDYPSMVWDPPSAALDRWLAIYVAVTERNRGFAQAGRLLRRWAAAAGFADDDVTYTTSTWTFTAPDERAWWADLWADRMTVTTIAEQAVSYGIATREELDDVAAGWREWGAAPAGAFVMICGELLVRV